LSTAQIRAGERPPLEAMPLVDIINMLEKKGFSPITQLSFDEGVWEVDAYNPDQEPRELTIHPVTGEILSNRRDH